MEELLFSLRSNLLMLSSTLSVAGFTIFRPTWWFHAYYFEVFGCSITVVTGFEEE